MGTTQRIVPGVKGQPNWGDLNKSIIHIAKTVEKEQRIEEEEKLIPKREDSDEIRIIHILKTLIETLSKLVVEEKGLQVVNHCLLVEPGKSQQIELHHFLLMLEVVASSEH